MIKGIRIISDGPTTENLRIFTDGGEELAGIRSVTINPMGPNQLITATVECTVVELDVVAEVITEKPKPQEG